MRLIKSKNPCYRTNPFVWRSGNGRLTYWLREMCYDHLKSMTKSVKINTNQTDPPWREQK